MGIEIQLQRLCCLLSVKKLLSIFGIVIAVVALLSHLLALPYEHGVGFEAETDLAIDENRSNVEVDSVFGIQKSGTSNYPEKRLNANSTIGFHLNMSTYSSEGEIRTESAQNLQLKSHVVRPSLREDVVADTGNKTSALMDNEATGSNSNVLRPGFASKRRRPASISFMNYLVQQNSSINLVV